LKPITENIIEQSAIEVLHTCRVNMVMVSELLSKTNSKSMNYESMNKYIYVYTHTTKKDYTT